VRSESAQPGSYLFYILFSAFPRGRSGTALLVLRAALGIALFVQGTKCMGADPGVWCGLTVLTGGTLLTIGFLTPLAVVLVGLGAASIGLSWLPSCIPNFFDTRISILLAAAMLVAVLLLGPGAFSVDARLFGRREIIIPPVS
jgi:uncharacterized membrane protein YphA (DoxX/SURF4 family)